MMGRSSPSLGVLSISTQNVLLSTACDSSQVSLSGDLVFTPPSLLSGPSVSFAVSRVSTGFPYPTLRVRCLSCFSYCVLVVSVPLHVSGKYRMSQRPSSPINGRGNKQGVRQVPRTFEDMGIYRQFNDGALHTRTQMLFEVHTRFILREATNPTPPYPPRSVLSLQHSRFQVNRLAQEVWA